MDAVSKRQIVLAAFLALQSWKIYELIVEIQPAGLDLFDNLLTFFFKWASIEIIFIGLVHRFRVPRLTFSLATRGLMFGALLCINLALVIAGPWMGSWYKGLSMMEAVQKERADRQADINSILTSGTVNDIIGSKDALIKDSLSHIAGEYTVKVRPWALAKLNPDSLVFCLPTSTAPPNSQGLPESIKKPLLVETAPAVSIPLQLTGVGPWTVVWEYAATKNLFSLEHRNSMVFTERQSNIPASKSGYYRLVSVTDGNGAEGRIPNPEAVFVGACPEARIDGYAIKNGIEMCSRTSFPLKIWASGTSPFDVNLIKYSGKSSRQIPFHSLKAEDKVIEGINKIGIFSLLKIDLKANEIDDGYGEHLLRVESIVDASGMERKYGEWDLGDSVMMKIFEPPTASWKLDPKNPPSIKQGQTDLKLPLLLKGRRPFKVTYQFIDPLGSDKVNSTTIEFDKADTAIIRAKLPGIYKVVNVSDSLCQGSPSSPEEIIVASVNPPSAKVNTQILKSQCHGDLGAIFDVKFEGSGPWQFDFFESVEGKTPKLRTIKSATSHISHKWIPETPGDYKVEFKTLSDSNYSQIPMALPSLDLRILPNPDFKIIGPKPSVTGEIFSCRDSIIKVQLRLSGIGPWNVEGSLATPSGESQSIDFSVPEHQTSFELDLPRFNSGGKHVLKLVKIKDKNGCIRMIEGQSLVINVLATIPSASYIEGQNNVQMREDSSSRIPLELEGNKGPWIIEISHRDFSGKVHNEQYKVENGSKGIPIDSPGLYTILSVKDQFCTGAIGKIPQAKVSLIKAPQVSFSSKSKPVSCRAAPSPINRISLDVQYGSGLVSIRYVEMFAQDESSLLSAKKIEKQVQLRSTGTGDIARIKLGISENRQPGFYKYQLLSVSDDVYSNRDLQLLPESSFTQLVLPDPVPSILQEEPLLLCVENSMHPTASVKIDITGSQIKGCGPWLITYDLLSETASETSRDAITEKFEKLPADLTFEHLNKPGDYRLRIKKVAEESFGCIWEAPSNPSAADSSKYSVPIHILQSPRIKLARLDKRDHVCVGDLATFELSGDGPWTIAYSLTKPDKSITRKTETVKTAHFTILLAEPGTLTIDSVSNQRCVVKSPLSLSVKSLPSAIIDPGIQYVREGEAAAFKVSLKGDAPFKFTYLRLDETTKEVLDRRQVTDVMSHDHLVEVEEGGTFRIESVEDQYCRYPKVANL